MWIALLKQPKLDSTNIAGFFAWFNFGKNIKLATVQGWIMALAFYFYFKRHTLPTFMSFFGWRASCKSIWAFYLWPAFLFGCTSKNIKIRSREGRTDLRYLSQKEIGQQLFLKQSVSADS